MMNYDNYEFQPKYYNIHWLKNFLFAPFHMLEHQLPHSGGLLGGYHTNLLPYMLLLLCLRFYFQNRHKSFHLKLLQ